MANPFFIPRKKSPLFDIAGLALDLHRIKSRTEIAKGRNKVLERDVSLREKAGAENRRISKIKFGGPVTPQGPGDEAFQPGLEQEKLGVSQKLLELKQDEASRSEETYKIAWQDRMGKPPDLANLSILADKVKAFEGPVNLLKQGVADKIVNTRWDAYFLLKQQGSLLREETAEGIFNEMKKLAKAGKQGGDKYSNLASVYNSLQKQTFLEDFFGFPEDMRGQTSRADIVRSTQEKVFKPESEINKMKRSITVNEYRSAIRSSPRDQGVAQDNMPLFNQFQDDTVAYWKTFDPGWWAKQANKILGTNWGDGSAKFISLPKEYKDAGWTPLLVQQAAAEKQVPIFKILQEMGLIK